MKIKNPPVIIIEHNEYKPNKAEMIFKLRGLSLT